MIRHTFILIFLCVIHYGCCSSHDYDRKTEVGKSGINKNDVGANGFSVNTGDIVNNFRNPVLEYLLDKGNNRSRENSRKGMIREIRHSQTLLIPFKQKGISFLSAPIMTVLKQVKPSENEEKTNERIETSPRHVIHEIHKNNEKVENHESCVTSSVLKVKQSSDEKKEIEKEEEGFSKIQVYPAVAFLINTYNSDGSLKSSLTHFQPDFSVMNIKKAFGKEDNEKLAKNSKNAYNNYMDMIPLARRRTHSNVPNLFREKQRREPEIQLFANNIAAELIKVSSLYERPSAGLYSADSSVIEYDPRDEPSRDYFISNKEYESDLNNEKDETSKYVNDFINRKKQNLEMTKEKLKLEPFSKRPVERETQKDENLFDEVVLKSEVINKSNGRLQSTPKPPSTVNGLKILKEYSRKRRDATMLFLKTKQGDNINITLQEPKFANASLTNFHLEKSRSFNPVLLNTHTLSNLMKPPMPGYNTNKKRKAKPTKLSKEDESSEEGGNEREKESEAQGPDENANEGIAVSSPPDGASVAEAKPFGLAIAGPGGVAASKPQGTAVVGPGGLAIARPVGTAIAGVEVEGSVPIGGPNKNKKKPKQEPEQTSDGELHYVGGLTGPIGNPQPKEFADATGRRTYREQNQMPENLYFRGKKNENGFQLTLGQSGDKYGFIASNAVLQSASPGENNRANVLQKRMDSNNHFGSLLGNGAQVYYPYQNYNFPY